LIAAGHTPVFLKRCPHNPEITGSSSAPAKQKAASPMELPFLRNADNALIGDKAYKQD